MCWRRKDLCVGLLELGKSESKLFFQAPALDQDFLFDAHDLAWIDRLLRVEAIRTTLTVCPPSSHRTPAPW
jgi:hypothetical protein